MLTTRKYLKALEELTKKYEQDNGGKPSQLRVTTVEDMRDQTGVGLIWNGRELVSEDELIDV